MLKKLAVLTIVLLVGAVSAATAQTPCQQQSDLAWLFAPPPDSTGDIPEKGGLAWLLDQQPVAEVAKAAPGSETRIELAALRGKPNVTPKTVTCSEDCNELPDISCSGSSCSAQSRECGDGSCIRGSVTCDGVTTYCSQVCPAGCTLAQCRQGCHQSGCVSVCINQCTCECDTICP